MNAKYLPSLSFAVMLTIAAVGVFVVGFAYGYEADPDGGPLPEHPKAEHAVHAKDLPPSPPLPGAMIEAHLAFLKTALKVTDAQTAAWNAVADVLREQAKRRDAEIAARRKAHEAAAEPPDLPRILQDRQHMAVEESDDLSKLLAALKPFYALLSAEQKEAADHLFPSGHPGMGHGGPPCLREASLAEGPDAECQPFFRHEVR